VANGRGNTERRQGKVKERPIKTYWMLRWRVDPGKKGKSSGYQSKNKGGGTKRVRVPKEGCFQQKTTLGGTQRKAGWERRGSTGKTKASYP